MTWLTWRQQRAQFLTAAAALVLAAAYLLVDGVRLRHGMHGLPADCGPNRCFDLERLISSRRNTWLAADALVLLAPALIGAFWGAPLIARELETGTHRMVWSQSVPRGRWLAAKLLLTTAAAVLVTGLLSLLTTWYAAPFDRFDHNRFQPLLFDLRGLVPLGYAAFAVALGACVGLFLRRTLAAAAVTLALFAAVQVLVPLAVRPHLQQPVHELAALNKGPAASRSSLVGFETPDGRLGPDSRILAGFDVPDGWVLSGRTPLPVRDATGRTLTLGTQPCPSSDRLPPDSACLAGADLYVAVDYQPADRYWTFQLAETGLYLALAAALAALTSWGLRRRLG
ncbi:ABC transporter permease [Kitasatospora sp. NA04385]|uniref:ABC transporter permease subunit n=1 Tax=Kitasatospora sp. NA04385 TaxID=2742135 RepID=UPI001591560D|nr:ABC transporter permease subunit [Kitasatospora sp. NA04385]QKW21832.1 ABC transporter permease [Kitasatospora sp. NA04385]